MNRFMQPLRICIQWLFLAFQLYLGVQFFRFVQSLRNTGVPVTPRPEGIEGFLPIAGLLGLKAWFVQGTLNPVHPAAVVILLSIIVISLLLKRSFCSWVCPVGTVSELLWKGGFNFFRKNSRFPSWLDFSLRGLKYLLLVFFLWSILIAMSPDQVTAFLASDYIKVADVRLLDFFLQISPMGAVVIGGLIVVSLSMRNPFCRFLCPYGALLGTFSICSPVKVTRNHDRCVSCGVCSQVCPSCIPVMKKERVVSPECLGCWRCVSHCRASGALSMMLTGRKLAINGGGFAVLVVLLFWGGSLVGKMTGNWHTNIQLQEYVRLLK